MSRADASAWRGRILLRALPLALLCACLGEPSPPPGGRRLVIVGVDGVTWNVVSPLMEQGRLPHLARLYRLGSAGLMKSIEPMLPVALWTTIATGKARGAHGLEAAAEKVPGRYAARPLTAASRRAPPIWTMASARGLTVGVAGWPATFPVDQVSGFMISDGYVPDATGPHGYLYPEGALGEGDEGEDLRMSPEAAAIASLDDELRAAFEEDLATLSRAAALQRVYQPRVALYRFRSIDLASHRFWQYYETRYLDLAASRGMPADPQRAAALAAALPGTYAFFDEWLGLLLERLPEKTTLLIVSDHGFRGVALTDYLHVDLNGLLGRLGFLAPGASGEPDWERTSAFSLDDIGGLKRPIFLNVRGREQQGAVEPESAEALRRRLADLLGNLRSDRGEALFRTVAPEGRPEAAQPDITVIENLGIDPRGTIRMGDGAAGVISLYRRCSDDLAAHDPAGVLLAVGEGIAAGRTGWSADLYDIVPTALYLVGLPLASDMPGRPIPDLLAQPVPADYPTIATYNDLPPAPAPVRRAPGVALAELDRLRGIGHLR